MKSGETRGEMPGERRPPLTGVAYEEARAAQAAADGFTTDGPGRPWPGAPRPSAYGGRSGPVIVTPFDPLRLCVYATVALLGWVLGPFAVIVFAGVGFAGYVRARRAGLVRSKCLLRDTRLVLAYLGLVVVAAIAAIVLRFFT
ncbi:hypothetical protein [Microtetraspora malaysiensis]|uniref:DUF4190 domain-containing protein n=1 Tax=Microtetraspora malaysiensis TaxID=161358 RepID=A0ABW6T6W5_9ACTN